MVESKVVGPRRVELLTNRLKVYCSTS